MRRWQSPTSGRWLRVSPPLGRIARRRCTTGGRCHGRRRRRACPRRRPASPRASRAPARSSGYCGPGCSARRRRRGGWPRLPRRAGPPPPRPPTGRGGRSRRCARAAGRRRGVTPRRRGRRDRRGARGRSPAGAPRRGPARRGTRRGPGGRPRSTGRRVCGRGGRGRESRPAVVDVGQYSGGETPEARSESGQVDRFRLVYRSGARWTGREPTGEGPCRNRARGEQRRARTE